jgi:hypothetical protein
LFVRTQTNGSRTPNQGLLRYQPERGKDPNLDLQILSVTLFEKTPILQALQPSDSRDDLLDFANQLNLFDL